MRRWRSVAAVLVGCALAAVAAFMLRAGSQDEAAAADLAQRRLAVLMIHGSGLDASIWSGMILHLRNAGWPADYLMAVDLRPDDGANIPAAESQLMPAAQSLGARARARARQEGWPLPDKIAIVAHSMGAVSGRWLAARLIPEQVAVFVAIAGPNHGSNVLCSRTGDGDRELCPARAQTGRSVLEQLNGTLAAPADETPYGPTEDPPGVTSRRPTATACIVWYAVLIDPDDWIVPAASARLAGGGGGGIARLPAGIVQLDQGEFVLSSWARHDDLPSTPAVMDLVTSMLEASTAACP